MNRIVKAAKDISNKYHTYDPFVLCDFLDICLTVTNLPVGINGFYNTVMGIPFIYLNSSLPYCEQKAVCAHELGHMILHPSMNTLFIKTKTIINADRLEREADLFAASLLIPKKLRGCELTVAEVAFEYDVPLSLVQTRMYI